MRYLVAACLWLLFSPPDLDAQLAGPVPVLPAVPVLPVVPVVSVFAIPLAQAAREDYVCLHFQRLVTATAYAIESPAFPLPYQPGEGCQWSATAVDPTARIVLDCYQFQLPPPKNGECGDALWISLSGRSIEKDGSAYCGTGPFTVVSDGASINAVLKSGGGGNGGRFKCTIIAAVPAGSNVTVTRPPGGPPVTSRPPSRPPKPKPAEAVNKRCDCGITTTPRENGNAVRIYGGREAGDHEFPFVAALLRRYNGGQRFLCGATILSTRAALSAAHCVEGVRTSDLVLLAGEGDREAASWQSWRQTSPISRLAIHPEFSGSWASPNLVIAFLEDPLRLGPAVGTICLPPPSYIDDSLALVDVLLVGWGSQTLSGPTSQKLRVAHQYVVPVDRCRAQIGPEVSADIHLCTLKDDAAACKGDPGGPVLWRSPRSGAMQIVGVLSHGRQCANNAAGLSTRIAPYVSWITATLRENLCTRS